MAKILPDLTLFQLELMLSTPALEVLESALPFGPLRKSVLLGISGPDIFVTLTMELNVTIIITVL